MRIAITSDLKFENDSVDLAQLADKVIAAQPELLVIAGNFGGSVTDIHKILSDFSRVDCTRAAVIGNKDLWNRGQGYASRQLWDHELPEALSQNNFVHLEAGNLILGRIGICGSMAWYDYSARDPSLKYSIEQYAELKGLVNADAQYVDWDWSDQEIASLLHADFVSRLEALDRSREIDHIIVVTHFPVFAEGMILKYGDQRWNFGAAYAFNLTFGRSIAPRSKVRHVISGHISNAGTWPVSFGQNVIQVHSVGIGDPTGALILIDV